MLAHFAILALLLIAGAVCLPAADVEGSGWSFREEDAAAATAGTAQAATSPTVSVKTRGIKCVSAKVCTGDYECGERGSCLGLLAPPGTCNCAACVNLWTCREDRDCGGLKGACDAAMGTCRCMQALDTLGFPLFKATANLCSVKKCGETREECFGLPCNTGRCVCKYWWIGE